jgi:hypothetical protein
MVDVFKDKTSYMNTAFRASKERPGGPVDDFDHFAAIEDTLGSAMENIQMGPAKRGNTFG